MAKTPRSVTRIVNADGVFQSFADIRAALSVGVLRETVGERLVKRIKIRTERGLDVNLNPFKPITEATKERRKRRSRGRPGKEGKGPLVHHERLLQSIGILDQSVPGAQFNTKLGFRIGATARNEGYAYGAAQNLGLGIPQRQFLGVNSLDIRSIERTVVDLVEDYKR